VGVFVITKTYCVLRLDIQQERTKRESKNCRKFDESKNKTKEKKEITGEIIREKETRKTHTQRD